TGTVTFMEGSTTLGTATLSGGSATFSISTLAPGQHHITAVYSGDSTFAPSTSSPLNQKVQKAKTTTALVSSPNPSSSGQPVTFTATVTVNAQGMGTATGTVTFRLKKTILGTVPVDSSGQAILTVSNLPVGATLVTAQYSGDADFDTSSGSVTQNVSAAFPLTSAIATVPTQAPQTNVVATIKGQAS